MLVWYGLKILTRFFGPSIMRYTSKKMQERFGAQFQQQQQQQQANQNRPREGETVIDKMPPRHQSSNKNVGEYIDYEEID